MRIPITFKSEYNSAFYTATSSFSFFIFFNACLLVCIKPGSSHQLERCHFVFIILHLLVYPASNGYNSYMDRDTGSIGGFKNPFQPTRQLFYVTIAMDIVAIVLSFYITLDFCCRDFFLYTGIKGL